MTSENPQLPTSNSQEAQRRSTETVLGVARRRSSVQSQATSSGEASP